MSVGLGEGVLGDPDIMMVMCVVEYNDMNIVSARDIRNQGILARNREIIVDPHHRFTG